MRIRVAVACICLLAYCLKGKAQNLSVSGYVENCTMVAETDPKMTEETLWQNITCLRTDVEWRMNGHWQMEVGIKNHLTWGNDNVTKELEGALNRRTNRLNLNWKILDTKGRMMSLAPDRCMVQWSANRWEVKAGRQRINWGQTVIWNPNDIFNPSPFVTLYYPEHSGCDAIRTTFYHNETARSELAASVDWAGKPTIAFLHANHSGETDFQLMGGVYKGSDMVIGGGMTTALNNVNIRMEGSYFHDFKTTEGETDLMEISLGADKIFPNNLTLQGEVLYTNRPLKVTADGIWERSFLQTSAKRLTISHWSLAGSVYYPFTPRCSIKAIGGYWHDHRSMYADMELKYQITQDLQVAATVHAADYNDDTLLRADAHMGTLRLKWNF
ncbi:MAG: hypothetical protein SPI18_10285 [Prevotella sp.]|nr:hypothetical protein [Prevotella sp.]MDY6131646.1 hypothetical protein [Prevotella sp.]